MNTEQKINAIMRYIVAETREGKNFAIAEIKKIIDESEDNEKSVNFDEVIDSILTEIGVPGHLIGYNYITHAVKATIENYEIINNVMIALYPAIAKKYNTTSSGVERGIRHAIECAWDRADIDVIEKHFGNTISLTKGKPTNSEFIARIANIVKRRMRNG